MSRECQVCGNELDTRGRCEDCYGVTREKLDALKTQKAYIVVCPDHGANEAPRQVKRGGKWEFPCPRCERSDVESLIIACERREKDWKEDQRVRVASFLARG